MSIIKVLFRWACTAQCGNEGDVQKQWAEKAKVCLWEMLQRSTEGRIFGVEASLCMFYWLIKASTYPGHQSQLTPTHTHIPANGSCSLPDVLLERSYPPATFVYLRKIPKGDNFWVSVHTVMPGHQQNGHWYFLWFALFWHINSGPYKQVRQCEYAHTSSQMSQWCSLYGINKNCCFLN